MKNNRRALLPRAREAATFFVLGLLALATNTRASTYDPNAAVTYADGWCGDTTHCANSAASNNAQLIYNTWDNLSHGTTYYNSYEFQTGDSGDCANFVSQCLLAGGLRTEMHSFFASSSFYTNNAGHEFVNGNEVICGDSTLNAEGLRCGGQLNTSSTAGTKLPAIPLKEFLLNVFHAQYFIGTPDPATLNITQIPAVLNAGDVVLLEGAGDHSNHSLFVTVGSGASSLVDAHTAPTWHVPITDRYLNEGIYARANFFHMIRTVPYKKKATLQQGTKIIHQSQFDDGQTSRTFTVTTTNPAGTNQDMSITLEFSESMSAVDAQASGTGAAGAPVTIDGAFTDATNTIWVGTMTASQLQAMGSGTITLSIGGQSFATTSNNLDGMPQTVAQWNDATQSFTQYEDANGVDGNGGRDTSVMFIVQITTINILVAQDAIANSTGSRIAATDPLDGVTDGNNMSVEVQELIAGTNNLTGAVTGLDIYQGDQIAGTRIGTNRESVGSDQIYSAFNNGLSVLSQLPSGQITLVAYDVDLDSASLVLTVDTGAFTVSDATGTVIPPGGFTNTRSIFVDVPAGTAMLTFFGPVEFATVTFLPGESLLYRGEFDDPDEGRYVATAYNAEGVPIASQKVSVDLHAPKPSFFYEFNFNVIAIASFTNITRFSISAADPPLIDTTPASGVSTFTVVQLTGGNYTDFFIPVPYGVQAATISVPTGNAQNTGPNNTMPEGLLRFNFFDVAGNNTTSYLLTDYSAPAVTLVDDLGNVMSTQTTREFNTLKITINANDPNAVDGADASGVARIILNDALGLISQTTNYYLGQKTVSQVFPFGDGLLPEGDFNVNVYDRAGNVNSSSFTIVHSSPALDLGSSLGQGANLYFGFAGTFGGLGDAGQPIPRTIASLSGLSPVTFEIDDITDIKSVIVTGPNGPEDLSATLPNYADLPKGTRQVFGSVADNTPGIYTMTLKSAECGTPDTCFKTTAQYIIASMSASLDPSSVATVNPDITTGPFSNIRLVVNMNAVDASGSTYGLNFISVPGPNGNVHTQFAGNSATFPFDVDPNLSQVDTEVVDTDNDSIKFQVGLGRGGTPITGNPPYPVSFTGATSCTSDLGTCSGTVVRNGGLTTDSEGSFASNVFDVWATSGLPGGFIPVGPIPNTVNGVISITTYVAVSVIAIPSGQPPGPGPIIATAPVMSVRVTAVGDAETTLYSGTIYVSTYTGVFLLPPYMPPQRALVGGRYSHINATLTAIPQSQILGNDNCTTVDPNNASNCIKGNYTSAAVTRLGTGLVSADYNVFTGEDRDATVDSGQVGVSIDLGLGVNISVAGTILPGTFNLAVGTQRPDLGWKAVPLNVAFELSASAPTFFTSSVTVTVPVDDSKLTSGQRELMRLVSIDNMGRIGPDIIGPGSIPSPATFRVDLSGANNVQRFMFMAPQVDDPTIAKLGDIQILSNAGQNVTISPADPNVQPLKGTLLEALTFGQTNIGQVYQLGPEGAKFSPPPVITFSYTPQAQGPTPGAGIFDLTPGSPPAQLPDQFTAYVQPKVSAYLPGIASYFGVFAATNPVSIGPPGTIPDFTPPVTVLDFIGISTQDSAGNIDIATNTFASFAAIDPVIPQHQTSGVVATYFLTDKAFVSLLSTPPTTYATPFTLGFGTHSITFFSVDNEGNFEAPKFSSVTVLYADTTPPITSLIVDGAFSTDTANDIIIASTVAVELIASDPAVSSAITASVEQTFYTIDVDPFSPNCLAVPGDLTAPPGTCANEAYGGPFNLFPGTHTVYFFSEDFAGNQEQENFANFISQGPSTSTGPATLPGSGQAIGIDPVGNVWELVKQDDNTLTVEKFAPDGATFISSSTFPPIANGGNLNISFDRTGNAYAVGRVGTQQGNTILVVYQVSPDNIFMSSSSFNSGGSISDLAFDATSGCLWIAGALASGGGNGPPQTQLALWRYSFQTGVITLKATYSRGNNGDVGLGVRVSTPTVWVTGYSAPTSQGLGGSLDLGLWGFNVSSGTLTQGPYFVPAVLPSGFQNGISAKLAMSGGNLFVAASRQNGASLQVGFYDFDQNGNLLVSRSWTPASGIAPQINGMAVERGGQIDVIGGFKVTNGGMIGGWRYGADGSFLAAVTDPAAPGIANGIAHGPNSSFAAMDLSGSPYSPNFHTALAGTDVLLSSGPANTVTPVTDLLISGAMVVDSQGNTVTGPDAVFELSATETSQSGTVPGVAETLYFIDVNPSNCSSIGTDTTQPPGTCNDALYQGAFTLAVGTHTLYYYAIDNADSEESPNFTQIVVSTAEPGLSVSPTAGPIGIPFTIAGSGFGTYQGANTRVRFGSLLAPLSIWNDTTISGSVPGLSTGAYSVSIEIQTGASVAATPAGTFLVLSPQASTMTPVAGPIGVPFTLTGSHFGAYGGAQTQVLVGGVNAALNVWNDTTISGSIPNLSSGTQSVVIVRTTSDGGLSTSATSYFNVTAPAIASVTPSSGPIGVPFTLTGTSFGAYGGNATNVLIGGATAALSVWTDTTISGSVPGALMPGSYPVVVVRTTSDGGYMQSSSATFSVTSFGGATITPSTGPIGIPFTISGSGFGTYTGSNTRIRFGPLLAPLSLWNNTTISGSVPGLSTGTYCVKIEIQSGSNVQVSTVALFTVFLPSATALSPQMGPIGVPFTITGAEFGSYGGSATNVLIGGATAALSVWNDTTISGSVPGSLAPGAYPVLVVRTTTDGGYAQSSSMTFAVTGIAGATMTPSTGPIGVPFTISGSGFGAYGGGNTRIRFGSLLAPLSIWNDTTIAGSVPGLSPGSYPVLIEIQAGSNVSVTTVTNFGVILPAIASVFPSSGPIGAPWTITGAGFGAYGGNATQVLLGGIAAPLSVWNDTTISGSVPGAIAAGTTTLVVARTTSDGGYASASTSFTVVVPQIISITPNSGTAGSGFQLAGAGFGPYQGSPSQVLIGGVAASLSLWNDQQIVGVVPDSLSVASYTVTVALSPSNGTISSNGVSYAVTDGGSGPMALSVMARAASPSGQSQPSWYYQASLNIPASQGGFVTTPGRASVQVPRSSISSNTVITIGLPTAGTKDATHRASAQGNGGFAAAGLAHQFGPEGTQFGAPVTITLPYDPSTLPTGKSETQLVIGWWNAAAASWQTLSTQVDTLHKRLSALTSHFSIYQPMMTGVANLTPAVPTPGFGLTKAYAFPNPTTHGQPVTIRALVGQADSVDFVIREATGKVLRTASVNGAKTATIGGVPQYVFDYSWDLSGASSGIYLFTITAHKAGSPPIVKTGKIGVIK